MVKINAFRVLWGRLKERNHFEDLGINGRMFLKDNGKVWIGLIWLRIGPSGGLL
jgi:hypothetical protein